MKILVISDTHGKIDRIGSIVKKHGGFDVVFHLGDHIEDAVRMADMPELVGVRIEAVKGNCDGAIKADECTKMVEADGFKFMLTHGHPYGVEHDLTQLYFAAKQEGADMVMFGHTHRAFYDDKGDIKIVNPGSISSPRDGRCGTYAVVSTDDGILECVTFEDDVLAGKVGSKRARGGFLRRTFNDSDGQ